MGREQRVINDTNELYENSELLNLFGKRIRSKVYWDYISNNFILSEEIIKKHQKRLNWALMSSVQYLPEKLIVKYWDEVLWSDIYKYQNLSEKFLIKYADKLDWNYISMFQKLSESIIKRFKDKVNWDYVCVFQKLSEEFILKFKDYINWNIIGLYQHLSNDFRKKYNINVPDNIWLYKDSAFKLDYLYKNSKFEINNDKIVGYILVKVDNRSIDNKYKFVVGEEYSIHSNYDINELESFGFNIYKNTKDVKPIYKYIKVGVDIDNIAAIFPLHIRSNCVQIL